MLTILRCLSFDGANLQTFYYWVKPIFLWHEVCIPNPAGHKFVFYNLSD